MAAQYVYVRDPSDDKIMEFPVSNDGTLPVYLINNTFNGFFGLKYNNEVTGFKRAVLTDPINQVFLAPEGGWDNKIFELVHSPSRSGKRSSRPYDGVQEANRLNTASVCPVKKSRKDNSNLPTSLAIQNFSFYIEENGIKNSVICLEKDFFCTFRHGTHKISNFVIWLLFSTMMVKNQWRPPSDISMIDWILLF
uniref:TAR DNA-binding protein 43 N-terminal domain-containing protein n=1 Tax=Meloidogyne enterolobii TaxID=390850 RepID=A0A6V7TNW3_MELEN|nr:unnamed protein product [Meloidogyne enterolobii]